MLSLAKAVKFNKTFYDTLKGIYAYTLSHQLGIFRLTDNFELEGASTVLVLIICKKPRGTHFSKSPPWKVNFPPRGTLRAPLVFACSVAAGRMLRALKHKLPFE